MDALPKVEHASGFERHILVRDSAPPPPGYTKR